MQVPSDACILHFTRYSSDIFHVWWTGSKAPRISLGFRVPKIIQIGLFLTELFKKIKMWLLLGHTAMLDDVFVVVPISCRGLLFCSANSGGPMDRGVAVG